MRELIRCVVQKYKLVAEDRGKVKRAIRVLKGGAAMMLGDEDVEAMEEESGLVIGVRNVGSGRDDWQLEVSY